MKNKFKPVRPLLCHEPSFFCRIIFNCKNNVFYSIRDGTRYYDEWAPKDAASIILVELGDPEGLRLEHNEFETGCFDD